MSLEATFTFIKTIENKLADNFSIKQVTEIMEVITDVLSSYSLSEKYADCNNEVDDLYDAYISAMKIQGLSDKTLWRYNYELKKMFSCFPGISSRQITVYHIRKYLQKEKERGISDRTLDGNRQIFSAYFGWLHREGLIPINPTSNIPAIRCPKRLKKAYTDVDVEKINTWARTPRDTAIIHTLQSTGCRISELVGMNISDVNLNRLEIVVIGKGDKERVVYIDSVTAMYIKQYLLTRSDSCNALFIGKRGDRLTPSGVRCMLRKVAKKAGVNGVHPHKFRRTLATNLNKRGMPVQEIAQVLGHEKIDTTMKYICMDETIVKNSYHRYMN